MATQMSDIVVSEHHLMPTTTTQDDPDTDHSEPEIIDLDKCDDKIKGSIGVLTSSACLMENKNSDLPNRSHSDEEHSELLSCSHLVEEQFIVYEHAVYDEKISNVIDPSVTLDSACESLIRVISYLQANPSIADHHLKTFWLILGRLKEKQKEMLNSGCRVESEIVSDVMVKEDQTDDEVIIMDDTDSNTNTASQHSVLVIECAPELDTSPSKKRKYISTSDESSTEGVHWNNTCVIEPKSEIKNNDNDVQQSTVELVHSGSSISGSEGTNSIVLDPVTDKEVERYIAENVLQVTCMHNCVVCEQRCESDWELEYHIKQQHMRSGQYKCNMCPGHADRFPHLHNLATHAQLHYGENKIKCSVCGRCCLTNSSLHTHKRSHLHKLRKEASTTDYNFYY